ncbi:AbrB/MazE/SpoVT family DNA-binding domain-containing protein [Tardiphaga alba]|uniref:AbrB/MazE/SpoVT family DNA-binding domain-containing protein n=1 Tax=Tardiphaga alba TaxID=340268 RepID=A0ABX8A9F0_9BRAD|nr:AbrB/MazE/SpoVT family DNA-binding domain-containing protein [Tardiphaga alba]QUS39025.1 AbrB/MazE/SpoVT family DNA-binding domain-containing protein [Tardiphaga alba]
MKVKVAKWGNSLGVRLPRSAADSIGVAEGSELVLTVERDGLRLRAVGKTSAQLLAEMIAEMKRLGPENEPETVDWGPDRGAEIIDDDYSRGLIVPGPDGKPVRVSASSVKRRAGKRNDPS